MKRILLALLLPLILCASAHGQCAGVTSCNAASTTQAAVQAAVSSANLTGTTVHIPAGGPTVWLAPVNYSGSISISIVGASTVATTNAQGNPATFNDLTQIVDGFGGPLFHIAGAGVTGGLVRISGITMSQTAQGTYELSLANSSGQVRVDHCHFIHLNPILRAFGYGVADHNLATGGVGTIENEMQALHGNGNVFWNQPTGLGSANFFFIENNTFVEGFGNDCNVGGQDVMRFNTLTVSGVNGGSFQSHATGSVQDTNWRGCRAWEVYKNTSTSSFGGGGSFAFSQQFSGTGVQWGNTVTGFTHDLFMVNDRDQLQSNYTQVAPPNGFGYCGPFQTGVPSPWDGNQNANGSRGWPCMDQPGRGIGDLLQGAFPNFCNVTLGCSTFNGQWPRQASEPIYVVLETYSGASAAANSPENNIQNNRDYYFQCDSNNSSCTGGFTGTFGTGSGVLASRPATCTVGVAYFATDQGSWNQSGGGGQGVLYKCTATNTWTLFYTPFTYPHPLTGGGTPVPIINCTPNPTPFGNQNINTSASLTLTCANIGTASETYSALAVSPSVFVNANTGLGGQCPASGSIAVGANCTVKVTFTPTAVQSYSGTLTVTGTVNASASLTGAGTNAISIPSAPTGLGATVSGSNSNLSWTGSTGTPAGYNVLRGTVTGGPYSLIATIGLTTAYVDIGLAPGTYFYRTNAFNSAGTSANSNEASATIVALVPIANLNPPSLNFPTTTVGQASAALGTNLSSAGTAALVLASSNAVTISGPNAADFAISFTGCTNSLSIAPGNLCPINVTFTPSVIGSETASLIILSNDANSPDSVSLTGSGTSGVTLSPPTITLANTYTSKTSATAVLTYTNNSGVSITVASIAFSGGDAAVFSETDNCVRTVTSGSFCTINITFTPTSNGSKTTNLVITDNASGSPRSIAVTGQAKGHHILRIGAVI